MVASMSTPTDNTSPVPKSPIPARRAQFNTKLAPRVANQLGLPERLPAPGLSQRFAFFADDKQLAVVAGAQEGDYVELALAYAVRHAKGRALTLVLPQGHTNATTQRVPWLREEFRPTIYTHRGGCDIQPLPPLTKQATVDALAEPRKGLSPADELMKATVPAHLGKSTDGVWSLVEWATTCPLLDPGHRSGERSWHYAGQRVLSLTRTRGGVSIVAGIHYGGTKKPTALVVKNSEHLSEDAVAAILFTVNDAIDQRKGAGTKAIHRADEHWLQAILRRSPHVVGVR